MKLASALRGVVGTGALMLALACPRIQPEETAGGSEDDGSDPGDPLDTLSDAELAELCDDLNLHMRERFTNRELAGFECTRVFLGSGDSLTCSQAVDECLTTAPGASPDAPRPPEFEIDAAECDAIGSCDIGINVFDDCIEDRFEQTDRLITRMTCGIASDPEAIDALFTELDQPRPVPSSCVPVRARCPGLL